MLLPRSVAILLYYHMRKLFLSVSLLGAIAAIPAIAGGIFADKTERFRKGGSAPIAHSGANGLRYLLQAAPE